MKKRTLCAALTLGPMVVGILAACLALAGLAALVTCSSVVDRLFGSPACARSESMREFLEESAKALAARSTR